VTARLFSAAPLVAAVLLYGGVAVPLRARADRARDAYAQARRARQQAQVELASLQRREAAWRQAALPAATPEDEAAAALRRTVLAALEAGGATNVRLSVRPSPRGPSVRVSATAPYAAAVRLAADMARPGTGLVLERVRLQPRADRGRVALEVEALAPRARS
jgi:hypothetical protein